VAQAVGLDMVDAGWRPTVESYLGQVTKPRILEAVREAKGEQAAQLIDHLKKGDMAREANASSTALAGCPSRCAPLMSMRLLNRHRRKPPNCRRSSPATAMRRMTRPMRPSRSRTRRNNAGRGGHGRPLQIHPLTPGHRAGRPSLRTHHDRTHSAGVSARYPKTDWKTSYATTSASWPRFGL